YTIVPSALVLTIPSNYIITYQPGTMYVNPSGSSSKNVKPSLICVQQLTNSPTGFAFVAHFSYNNPNSTPVFVPIGVNNIITAQGNYSGVQPQLFNVGTGYFDIYFDGQKLVWTLTTRNSGQNTATSSNASSTSSRCPKNYVSPTATGGITAMASDGITQETAQESLQIAPFTAYPNPTHDRLNIYIGNAGTVMQRDIQVYSIAGKQVGLQPSVNSSTNIITLDVSGLSAGAYLVLIRLKDGIKVVKFVKM
ncbi:MAG TPA: T9SS type A sorting domain-containing protein, partial [Puia sp.]|nr:T9SS type A sorting domain-containing protein [Puia sp.]